MWQGAGSYESVFLSCLVILSCLPGFLVVVMKFSHQPQEIKNSAIGSTQMRGFSSVYNTGHTTNPVTWAARAKPLISSLT
jgi:hypothetical protein